MAAGDEGLEKASSAAVEAGADRGDAAPRAMPGERSKLAEELRVGRAPVDPARGVHRLGDDAGARRVSPRGSPISRPRCSPGPRARGRAGRAPFLARRNARAGRHLGISLFVALSVGQWLLGAQAIPSPSDSTRSARVARRDFAWGVFALSWSDRWGPGPAAIPADPGAPLLFRAALPFGAVPITALAVAAALALLLAARLPGS